MILIPIIIRIVFNLNKTQSLNNKVILIQKTTPFNFFSDQMEQLQIDFNQYLKLKRDQYLLNNRKEEKDKFLADKRSKLTGSSDLKPENQQNEPSQVKLTELTLHSYILLLGTRISQHNGL